VNNEGAIKFYEKFGFKIVEEKQNYYKRIEPADAYVLQKTFRGEDPSVNGTDSSDKLDSKTDSESADKTS